MRKVGMILLAFVLAGSLMAGAMPVAATSGGSISGHVYRSPEGTAISAATVWLRNYPLFPNYLVRTTAVDGNGSYKFSELPTGQYAVWVTTGLRASEWYDGDDGALDSCAAQAVSVTDSDTISGIDFTLASGGHIQGVVYGPDGSTPIAGAYVVVVDYTVPDKPECFLGAGQTNMSGLYTTSGLPTGQYKVFATAIGYASQWYGNTYNYWAATAVSVTAGSFTAGKNFTLASGGSVSGTVTHGTNPIAGAMVLAYDYGMLSHMKPNVLSTAFTNPDGTYTLNGLAAGQYAIRASASNYTSEYYCNDQHNALAANPVSVTAGSNTSPINFALDLGGGTISGNVTDDTNPIGGAWVGVFDRDSMINHIMVAYDVAFTDASGNYSTVRLPAANHYAVRVLASGRAAEWWDNKYNINDSSAVTVADNSNTPGKNFALDVGGTISGNVSDEAAHPIPGAAVVVYAYNSLPTALVGYSVSSTDSAGNYTSNGLPAGDYAVWAIAAGYDAEWWQEASAVGDADAVVVTAPGNMPDIDFALATPSPISSARFDVMARYNHTTDVDAVDNSNPLLFDRAWLVRFSNMDSTHSVSHVTLSADASNVGPIVGTDPGYWHTAPTSKVCSTYTWDFYNVPLSDIATPVDDPRNPPVGNLIEGSTYSRYPGFDSKREVVDDKEIFTEPGYQTVTVKITPRQPCSYIAGVFLPQFVHDTNLVSWEIQGPSTSIFQLISNPEVNKEYKFSLTLLVKPKAGPVRFVPTAIASVGDVKSYSSYNNTASVTANATDILGRSLIGTATTSQIVNTFATMGWDQRNVVYRAVNALHVSVGQDVAVEDPSTGVSTTFSEVGQPGDLQVNVSEEAPEPSQGFQFIGKYYDISTEATYSGPITVTIGYDDTGMSTAEEQGLRLYHLNGSNWEDVTMPPVDTVNNKITGQVDSLSWFVVGAVANPFTSGISRVWVGLKNSDEVGAKFDLKAEVYNGAQLAGSGEVLGVSAGSSGFNNARLSTINITPVPGAQFFSGDTLSIKLLVRKSGSRYSPTARFWYDGKSTKANSCFDVTIGGNATTYYLRSGSTLSTEVGTGNPGLFIDVGSLRTGGTYQSFGTWSTTLTLP